MVSGDIKISAELRPCEVDGKREAVGELARCMAENGTPPETIRFFCIMRRFGDVLYGQR